MLDRISQWLDRNIFSLARDMQFSYLPPLMVYMAAGISGLTSIVGTFFVKEYLGLSAAFLAGLAFWINIPWALKMPMGHLVDLIWRWKGWLVFLGAGLITVSLLVMIGLLTDREAMTAIMPAGSWFVLSALLAPIGYVIQDTVADGMTVEAVPRFDAKGDPLDEQTIKLKHTTMQTLGRFAIIGGSVLVAIVNLSIFKGVQLLPEVEKILVYRQVYLIALTIPMISVAGIVLAAIVKRRELKRLLAQGVSTEEIKKAQMERHEKTEPNWWILGGSLAFVAFTLVMGFSDFVYAQETIFLGSFLIIAFLIVKLTRELTPQARATLLGTVIIIFAFRATPTFGAGATWWMIDELRFDQRFIAILDLIGGTLTLVGIVLFRRFMAERSIAYIVGILTIAATLLSLPYLGMYYGLHEWTSAMTNGIVDARFIAVVNTALESPLGQIAMIPMLAWIANSAPPKLKATYFAVMASFTNLALSLAQLCTKYLNQIFIVTREVKDPVTKVIEVPANYSQLGDLIITALVIGFVVPFAAILIVRISKLKWA